MPERVIVAKAAATAAAGVVAGVIIGASELECIRIFFRLQYKMRFMPVNMKRRNIMVIDESGNEMKHRPGFPGLTLTGTGCAIIVWAWRKW